MRMQIFVCAQHAKQGQGRTRSSYRSVGPGRPVRCKYVNEILRAHHAKVGDEGHLAEVRVQNDGVRVVLALSVGLVRTKRPKKHKNNPPRAARNTRYHTQQAKTNRNVRAETRAQKKKRAQIERKKTRKRKRGKRTATSAWCRARASPALPGGGDRLSRVVISTAPAPLRGE